MEKKERVRHTARKPLEYGKDINAVQPVFSVRSFEMENKEVQVGEALDVIKESLAELPEES